MELFKASAQWAKRPDDERFSSLEDLHTVTKGYADIAKTSTVPYSSLRTEVVDGDVKLAGKTGIFAKLTHWSFGQLSRIAEAPADYLRELPATLAVQNLNHGLKEKSSPTQAHLMFHQNGELVLRSATSDRYDRIWNHEVISRLIPLQADGWRTPPARPALIGQKGARPAALADISLRPGTSGLAVKLGDMIAPSGLYASDHDMFAFLVNENYIINDGTPEGLARGFFVENSEVGASAFKLTQFLYRYVCGNHIVWGAEKVKEISVRHIGDANGKAWANLQIGIKKYAESSASDLEAKIKQARTFEIAKTKDEVLDKLFNMRLTSRKTLEAGYDIAETYSDLDGSPRTVWGMVQGLTRTSQLTAYADQRNGIDRVAGKLMEMAF